VFGAFLAGSIAESFGVGPAIGGTAAIMMGYAAYAFRRSGTVRSL
jgi:hypothetical protein